MKALTLWRPWPAMIFHVPEDQAKRLENRGWRPPAGLIGHRIAIHAGEHLDHRSLAECRRMLGPAAPTEAQALAKGIIGTAVVVGVLRANDLMTCGVHLEWAMTVGRWFVGPFGWLLDEAITLPEPIPCKGRQGLWTVPSEIAARLA